MKQFGWLGLVLSGVSFFSQAANSDFQTCLTRLKSTALSNGITQATIADTLDRVKPRKQVIKADKNQPEFTSTFQHYFDKRVTAWRVLKGRKMMKEHHDLLAKLTNKYGVPGQYIVAFWGLETNYGSYKGNLPVIDSLTTLACKPRRAKFFTQELMKALKLKQKNGFSYDQMRGSWAGAMGHTQFMPSTFARYAVDADADGKADLWNSEVDALTSAANFLMHLGWKREQRWGREVQLPTKFDYTPIGSKQKKSLSEWRTLGVQKADGKPLSVVSGMDAVLYLPSGHKGPAFLGYDNFNVIMKWNRSEFYAISVGHLADRIAGAGRLISHPPKIPKFKRKNIKAMQQKLLDLGYKVGKPDGIIGRNTVKALQQYQKKQGILADGFPSKTTFIKMGIKD
ncbi:lytic murein transglycosylase [Shewanella sp. 202IG2-18]|uniref:lytic murein transglycosylase n=1 Tax=Parashewanella hymeniacidonis TaxID=2807618 RepID=UPI00195FA1B0|nr:lytic murein transglycosylase [Parashewanella hymeniacidonis]MBM7073698.1 lytic murein transglycosylase [Parashewanella hymeniacidonis]